jgi:HPt (histidine-containing phosphotransfer) domain-containing protein
MEQPNSNYIDQLAGDDQEFKGKVIAILKKELPEEIELYNNQMSNKNFKLAAKSVHKLKHKVSILGLEKSYYIAEEYENNLNENATNMQSEFEAILQSMHDFVNKL